MWNKTIFMTVAATALASCGSETDSLRNTKIEPFGVDLKAPSPEPEPEPYWDDLDAAGGASASAQVPEPFWDDQYAASGTSASGASASGARAPAPTPAPVVRPFLCAARQQLPGQQPGSDYYSPAIFGANTALIKNTGGFGGSYEVEVYYAGPDGLVNTGDPGEGMKTIMSPTSDSLDHIEIGANHIVWSSRLPTGDRTIWLYDMGDGIPGNNDPLEGGPFVVEAGIRFNRPRIQGDLLSWQDFSNFPNWTTKFCDMTLVRGTSGSCANGRVTAFQAATSGEGLMFDNGVRDVLVTSTNTRGNWEVIQSDDFGATWQPLLVSNAFHYGIPDDTAYGTVLVGERSRISPARSETYLAIPGVVELALPEGGEDARLSQVPPVGQRDLLVAFEKSSPSGPSFIGVVKADFSSNMPYTKLVAPSNEFYSGHDIYGDTVVFGAIDQTTWIETVYYSSCN